MRDEIERSASEAASLKEAATTDKLTGLPNRRYLDEVLPALLRLRQQTATPMAIAFIDLDHFKNVNDHYGHPMGDQVLRGFGEIAMHATRNADVMGRQVVRSSVSPWWAAVRRRRRNDCGPCYRYSPIGTSSRVRKTWSGSHFRRVSRCIQKMASNWNTCSRPPIVVSTKPSEPDVRECMNAILWLRLSQT